MILYDKLKAAKDLKTDFWFDVWKIDRNDPGIQVWRAEFRGGKVSLGNFISKVQSRIYEALEAILPQYLAKASQDIRYVTNRGGVSNITRATVHPLWVAAQEALTTLLVRSEPALPRAYALEQMRLHRLAMAEAQAFGNLSNQLLLEGYAEKDVYNSCPQIAARLARKYSASLGRDRLMQKLELAENKLGVFTGGNLVP